MAHCSDDVESVEGDNVAWMVIELRVNVLLRGVGGSSRAIPRCLPVYPFDMSHW